VLLARSAAAELDRRGGHPAVDLVNTVAWRGDPVRRTDYLIGYVDLLAWSWGGDLMSNGEAQKLVSEADRDAGAAKRVLHEVTRLRESLHALWTAGASSPVDIAAIAAAYATARRRQDLHISGDRARWAERALTLRSPLDRLALTAVDLITTVAISRVNQCHDNACGWLFLDHSHRQNRRWCSTADCGNRDRARRHYRRTQTLR
jgi:predicted RNA-binding Zn ribbon-like protein